MRYLLRFLLCFSITLVLFGCTQKDFKSEKIKTYKISDCRNNENKVFYGQIKSEHQTELSFQTEGRIDFIPYTKGDFVKKGTVVARLDGVLYKIRKQEEEIKLKDSILQLNKAKSYYKRMDDLHKKGAISDNDWEDAYYSYLTNEQLAKAQKEKLRYIKQEINYNIITAPYDGYIAEKLAEVGSYATIGKPVLIINGSNYSQAEIITDSKTVNSLNLDNSVNVEKNGINYPAKISHISKTSNSDGGYLVKIKLDKLYPNLKEGMDIIATLPVKKETYCLAPLNSIVEKDNQKYIYKVDLEGKISEEKIIIQNINDSDIEILKGVELGDLIIQSPDKSILGSKVKL